METLLVYGLKSAALMSAFFIAYYFLLRKETFFKSNRWYLLAGLITSVILPSVTIRQVVMVDPVPVEHIYEQIPMHLSPELQPAVSPSLEISWQVIVLSLYLLGTIFFLLKFIADCYAVYRILKGKIIERDSRFKLLDVDQLLSPFSFFNYIVYNSSLYSIGELKNILEHEKVHCRQKHTADVLISRVFCIFFWWNPFAWLHHKAILQNLEFIADAEATSVLSDKKSYQFTLLKITTHNQCVSISNHFYQSLIKKRIVMLNKNQSTKWNSWKYAVIVPALLAFIFYFQVQVVAQVRNVPERIMQDSPMIEVIVDKDATDFYLNSESKRLKDEHGITLKFSGVKRNDNREIVAIKTTFKDNDGNTGKSSQSGTEPITPFRFYQDRDDDGKITAGIGNVGNQVVAIRTMAPRFPVVPSVPKNADGSEFPEAPEAPDAPATTHYVTTTDGEHVTVTTVVDKKGNSKIIVNGEEVADVDVAEILAELDPIFINGIDVLQTGKKDGDYAVHIKTDEISREVMEEVRREMQKVRPELERARAEMQRHRPEMERAKREMGKAQREMQKVKVRDYSSNDKDRELNREDLAQARRDLEQSKRDMERATREIEQAKRDIEQSKRDIEQSRKELEEYKKQLDSKK